MSEYKGNPMVSPDGLTCNGRPVKAWILEQPTVAAPIRRSVELYRPSKVPQGQVARPLTYADVLPPAATMPTAAAPVKPSPSVQVQIGKPAAAPTSGHDPKSDKLAELRRTCNMNRNMGNKVIPIDFVLKCLES